MKRTALLLLFLNILTINAIKITLENRTGYTIEIEVHHHGGILVGELAPHSEDFDDYDFKCYSHIMYEKLIGEDEYSINPITYTMPHFNPCAETKFTFNESPNGGVVVTQQDIIQPPWPIGR